MSENKGRTLGGSEKRIYRWCLCIYIRNKKSLSHTARLKHCPGPSVGGSGHKQRNWRQKSELLDSEENTSQTAHFQNILAGKENFYRLIPANTRIANGSSFAIFHSWVHTREGVAGTSTISSTVQVQFQWVITRTSGAVLAHWAWFGVDVW